MSSKYVFGYDLWTFSFTVSILPHATLQIAQRSQWRAYRKLPSLFLMVPSLTPYDLSFPPKRRFHMPPTYANGHISATGDPIHFMFCSRIGFSGTADLMGLFPVRTNPRWRPPPSWIISNGHISQQLTIYLYSAHRAVIFAIAQLSCLKCHLFLQFLNHQVSQGSAAAPFR